MQQQTSAINRTRITVICLISLALISGLVALGSWQIQRYSWKQALIARVEHNIHAEPVEAPTKQQWQQAEQQAQQQALEYRAVRLQGQYLNTLEIPVHALTQKGSGYWILTPFQRNNGEIVLINRGFVPTAQREAQSRASGQIEGPTQVSGLLRLSEPKGFFLRQNDPANRIWYARDTKAMTAELNLDDSGYFIDADSSQNREDRPVGGMTVITFADNHIAYALTWFTLALMVLGMAFYLIRYEIRKNNSTH